METEELIKLVDGIYKNILDKFNPGARQMINAGKAYLKALHSAAAASRLYVDAISKLAKQAQQGTWGGSSDIGGALMKIVEVYKEIQDQQMNILKAFYVDLLVPLETNLEKDTKVVQSEQKRFLQQHKQRSETYSKAAAMMKKQRKKSRGSSKTGLAMDKELKNMQVLEEEKTKLDTFCELSLKNAMTQERRRYGFVLERQCSLAKHYLSYHTQGVEAYQQNIDKWSEVAKTREYLPESVEHIFTNRLRQISVWQDDDLYSNPRSPNFEDDRMSISSQLRKTKSMDASCLDIRSIGDVGSPVNTLSRAKSEYNLNTSNQSLAQENHTLTRRPKPVNVPPPPTWDTQLVRALYAYLSSGENQLSFHEGDLIALIGERNKGWQFGENLRTQCSGWFPLAYTELLDDPSLGSGSQSHHHQHSNAATPTSGSNVMSSSGSAGTPSGNNTLEQPARMFGDTLHLQRSSNNAKQIRRAIGFNNIPPPALPAPVPTPTLPYHLKSGITQSQSTTFPIKSSMESTTTFQSPYGQMKSSTSTFNFATSSSNTATSPYSTHPQPVRTDRPTVSNAPSSNPTPPSTTQVITSLPLHLQTKEGKIGVPVGNVSLHSSNDSGFSNDPPPQPEIDYSDDDSIPSGGGGQTKLPSRRRHHSEIHGDKNNNNTPQARKPIHPHLIKQSNSHGNLVEKSYYISDAEISAKDHKNLVKRTKSFWRFGKNSSDSEILEGMALWRHRDLVDVDDEQTKSQRKINSQQRVRRDNSSDSDRTINGKQNGERFVKENNGASNLKHQPSFKEDPQKIIRRESQKVQQVNSRKELKKQKVVPSNKHNDEMNEHYDRNRMNDQFYDDDGDGLMMKTVNRKNILQQYDTSGTDSDSESDLTSDPYDCIVVDDQKVDNSEHHQFPNVAELGKRLEKLSKSNKYSPNKEINMNNQVQEKNKINNRRHRAGSPDENNLRNAQNHKKSSRKDINSNDKEIIDSDKYYNMQNYGTRNGYHGNNNNKQKNSKERRNRSSYESIESENVIIKSNNKHYDSTNDELSEIENSQQFLPRTKLTKTNSNNTKYEQHQQEIGLTDYGETLQRRLKNTAEFAVKYDDKTGRNGNMYGPWYDLWGLDASVKNK